VNAYMTARANLIASTTWERLKVRMKGTILPEIGQEMAYSISPDLLDRYAAERARTVKQVTIHREISDIRAVLRWSVGRKLIARNPMDGYEMPKLDNARISPPSKPEFEAILACAGPHLQRAMLISWFTGLRPGREELLSLRWDAVDLHSKTIMVLSAVKGGMPRRMVPLHDRFIVHLKEWCADDLQHGYQYLVHYYGQPIESLKTAWKNAKKRAMITRRLRLYDIRHAFATQLISAGANLKAVSEILGHASPVITMEIYQHVSGELHRRAVDLLD